MPARQIICYAIAISIDAAAAATNELPTLTPLMPPSRFCFYATLFYVEMPCLFAARHAARHTLLLWR